MIVSDVPLDGVALADGSLLRNECKQTTIRTHQYLLRLRRIRRRADSCNSRTCNQTSRACHCLTAHAAILRVDNGVKIVAEFVPVHHFGDWVVEVDLEGGDHGSLNEGITDAGAEGVASGALGSGHEGEELEFAIDSNRFN